MNRTGQGNQGVVIHRLGQARHFLRQRGIDCAKDTSNINAGKICIP